MVKESGGSVYKYRASYEDDAGTFAGWFLVVADSPTHALDAALARVVALFGVEANASVSLQTITLDPAELTNV